MEKEEWMKRYKARIIAKGLSHKEAQAITEAASDDPYQPEDNPEDAADEELSYWPSDG